jgi:hypothetical protein
MPATSRVPQHAYPSVLGNLLSRLCKAWVHVRYDFKEDRRVILFLDSMSDAKYSDFTDEAMELLKQDVIALSEDSAFQIAFMENKDLPILSRLELCNSSKAKEHHLDFWVRRV